jgi:hypothetical protein
MRQAKETLTGVDREEPMKFTSHERDFNIGTLTENTNYITDDGCVNILACLLGKRAPYPVPPGQFGGPPKEPPPPGTPPPIAQ